MSLSVSSESGLGSVMVVTTNGCGQSPEEIAERALNKIISVGDNSHPLIKEQANAYRNQIREVLIYYIHEAVKAEHTNIANRLRNAGRPEITPIALGE